MSEGTSIWGRCASMRLAIVTAAMASTVALGACGGAAGDAGDASEGHEEPAATASAALSGAGFRISLTDNPNFALYAMDGIATGSRIGITSQCTDSDVRCKFILGHDTWVSAANPALALTSNGTTVSLQSCTPTTNDKCQWAYGYGDFVNGYGGGYGGLAVNGPIADGTLLKLDGTQVHRWTIQHAVISFAANEQLHWYAAGGGVIGSAVQLKNCSASDANCTWTINGSYNFPNAWTHINSDSNPALQAGNFTSTVSGAPLTLKSCTSSPTDNNCNWFFQGGIAQMFGLYFGAAATATGAYNDGVPVVAVNGQPSINGLPPYPPVVIGPGPLTPSAVKPCDQLCTNPKTFSTPSYQSGSLGGAAVCYETTSALAGGNCSNPGTRSVTVNGTAVTCNGNWPTLPPKRAGGYCIQVSAGSPTWTSFATW